MSFRALMNLAGCALVLALAGCVSAPVETSVSASPTTAAGAGAASGDIRTASDISDPERRARVRLELASAYFARGQLATALDETKLALAAKPDLPEAFNLRGLVYASMGETALAEQSFQRALQLAPRDGDALHNYAWFQCQQGRFEAAERLFQQVMALPRYPGLARSTFAQGACQARAGQWLEAERTLSRAYELDPSNPVTAYNLAEVLLRRGELQRARFYIGRVNAVREQSNAQSLWLAARIEHRAGDRAAAQQFGRQLRDRFPQSAEALQFDRGRFDEP